jgi:hypothetical protein
MRDISGKSDPPPIATLSNKSGWPGCYKKQTAVYAEAVSK